MEIKRNVLFFLQSEKGSDNGKLRARIRWDKKEANFNVGFRVFYKKWNKDAQQCKRNTSQPKGFSAFIINSTLRSYEENINTIFKEFEAAEIIPTLIQFKEQLNIKRGKKTQAPKVLDFFGNYDLFIKERGIQNDWTTATFAKLSTVKSHLYTFSSKLTFDELSEGTLNSYILYLRDNKKMLNSTIKKQLGYFKWFLNWADSKGLITIQDYKTFKPKLKTSKNEIVYLTSDEIKLIKKAQIPENKQYLTRVRDIFLFGCYTSLRYSDIFNLKKANIKNNKIEIVTIKTEDKLSIQLMPGASEILEKYKDIAFNNDKALPVISNQRMNDYLKELCEFANINTPITHVSFSGNKRTEITKPKYQMIGTHTARRTFICNALLNGMPAHAVMKITGHSDYKAMQPYIDIVGKEVDNMMMNLKF